MRERLVHLLTYEKGFMNMRSWALLCGFEAWNGAKFSEKWGDVTCPDCLKKKPRSGGKRE